MKAQLNSEILKWILMILIFAIAIIIVIALLQGLPEAVSNLIKKIGAIL